MIELVAALLKILGVGFLAVATIGVLRFRDPFQRMHAATKAGTLGAGLVLLGTVASKGTWDATLVGLLTVLFLLMTMPVAGHLLGRAAYVSGAPLRSREDALAGVLPREERSLEERLETVALFARPDVVADRGPRPTPARPDARAGPVRADERPAFEPDAMEEPYAAGFDAVRFTVIAPHAGLVAERAARIAAAECASLTALAIVDETFVAATRDPLGARTLVRAKLAEAVLEMREAMRDCQAPLTLVYQEGDPERLIPATSPASRELLVLPCRGWCHHGVGLETPTATRLPDGLLRLASLHAGPTLYVHGDVPEDGRIVVVHDGSRRVQRLAIWAIRTGIWNASVVHVRGPLLPGSLGDLEDAAAGAGLRLSHDHRPAALGFGRSSDDVIGVVLPDLPRPLRTDWYGCFWQDRIAPGWRGDVLVGS